MKQTLVCFETEEQIENPRYPTEPKLAEGGPDSGLPPPYLVATGQAGHTIVGIDIGSKFSRVATFEQDKLELLTAAPVPSLACRLQTGNLTVGMKPTSDTVNVIQDFRGLIGSDWYVEAECGFYSADMLTELMIKVMKSYAESATDRPISKAVLTCPVTFTSFQRKLLKLAGENAGLDVLQLINEPTAAAFYHCYENREMEGNLLVYSLGASCFAASVMEFRHGLLEVKQTIGHDRLSGNAFVGKLIGWMIDEFNDGFRYQLDQTPATILRMVAAAEQAIADLYTAGQAHIKLTNLDIVKNHGTSSKTHAYLMTSITMKEYLKLVEPVVEETLTLVDQVIKESNVSRDSINQVLMLADNRSLMPYWNRFFERFPGATILPCSTATFPVYGAALQAALLSHSVRNFVVWDIVTEPVWAEQDGKLKQVIARGTPVPVTAYHKCNSPDAAVNLHVSQGSENLTAMSSLADITVINCPPSTNNSPKVEVHFIASADGIIDYRAKHIELDSQLPLRIIEGQPVQNPNGWSDTTQTRTFDDDRLNRLSRIMNMPPLTVLNILRAKGYTIESIKNGRAIEDMLRKLKTERMRKYA